MMTSKPSTPSTTAKIKQIVAQDSLTGLARRGTNRLARPFLRYWRTSHAWEGRLLETFGHNRIRIEGVKLDLSHPRFTPIEKAPFLKGIYEGRERRMLRDYWPDPLDLPVIELGGSIGLVSCIINRRMAKPQSHVVVEPNPDLLSVLEHHRELNNCQFEIVNAALAYEASEVTLYLQERFVKGNLMEVSDHKVSAPATNLQALADERDFAAFDLFCDIEGSEVELVAREMTLIKSRVRHLIMEVHEGIPGKEAIARTLALLDENGLVKVEGFRRIVCYRNPALQRSQ